MARLADDPTRTTTLRGEYARAHEERFDRVAALVRTTVEENDALRLDAPSPFALQEEGDPAFDFGPGPVDEKIDLYADWLRRQQRRVVLEVDPEDDTEGATRPRDRFSRILGLGVVGFAWQHPFLRRAHLSGVRQADAKLRAQGVDAPGGGPASALGTGPHREALRTGFTQNARDLRNATRTSRAASARVMADLFRRGADSREMADALVREVGVGKRNATVAARTHIIQQHAEATLLRFRQLGVEKVVGFAEFATARDNRVCPDCEALEGEVFTIDEARGQIPVHLQCRCTWLPLVERPSRNVRVRRVYRWVGRPVVLR